MAVSSFTSIAYALYLYVNSLESPLEEAQAQITAWAQKVVAGQTGRVTSTTINGKTFTFEDRLSPEEFLQIWTMVKAYVVNDGVGTSSTGIQFEIVH